MISVKKHSQFIVFSKTSAIIFFLSFILLNTYIQYQFLVRIDALDSQNLILQKQIAILMSENLSLKNLLLELKKESVTVIAPQAMWYDPFNSNLLGKPLFYLPFIVAISCLFVSFPGTFVYPVIGIFPHWLSSFLQKAEGTTFSFSLDASHIASIIGPFDQNKLYCVFNMPTKHSGNIYLGYNQGEVLGLDLFIFDLYSKMVKAVLPKNIYGALDIVEHYILLHHKEVLPLFKELCAAISC